MYTMLEKYFNNLGWHKKMREREELITQSRNVKKQVNKIDNCRRTIVISWDLLQLQYS